MATLSIPAWFDWRPIELFGTRAGPAPFNPSLVRLAPFTRRDELHLERPFNPSLVRLARSSRLAQQ